MLKSLKLLTFAQLELIFICGKANCLAYKSICVCIAVLSQSEERIVRDYIQLDRNIIPIANSYSAPSYNHLPCWFNGRVASLLVLFHFLHCPFSATGCGSPPSLPPCWRGGQFSSTCHCLQSDMASAYGLRSSSYVGTHCLASTTHVIGEGTLSL